MSVIFGTYFIKRDLEYSQDGHINHIFTAAV